MMRMYQRQETGVGLCTEDVLFYPFFFLTDIRLLHGFPRDKFRCKTLRGSNAYQTEAFGNRGRIRMWYQTRTMP